MFPVPVGGASENVRVVPDTVYALPEPGSCWTLPTNTSMSVSKLQIVT